MLSFTVATRRAAAVFSASSVAQLQGRASASAIVVADCCERTPPVVVLSLHVALCELHSCTLLISYALVRDVCSTAYACAAGTASARHRVIAHIA
jgi:hypothetical protein